MNVQRSSPRHSASYPSPTEALCPVLGLFGMRRILQEARPILVCLEFAIVLALTFAVACGWRATVCDSVRGDMCNQCFGNVYTCTYEGVSVTTRACEGCQARLALYDELCALGRTDSRAEVDASMVCELADTGTR